MSKKRKMPVEREITNAIEAIVKKRSKHEQMPVGWIALQALKRFDPSDRTPLKLRHCALVHLRQVTMSVLRYAFDPLAADERNVDQGALPFAGFQDRYPVPERTADGDHQYLPFKTLTPPQLRWNAQRLKLSGESRIEHANALFAEAELREHQAKTA